MKEERSIRRLNWGCGAAGVPGWVNSDAKQGPGIDISCDIRDGFPLPDDTFDYIVAIHALPEIPYDNLRTTLQELRRVLKPGGTLRVALPDLDKGIDAYRRADRDYFLVPDDAVERLGSKFAVQMVWFGYSRSLFTRDYIEEVLEKAGFWTVEHHAFRETGSGHPGITELDNRERESLFVEAVK